MRGLAPQRVECRELLRYTAGRGHLIQARPLGGRGDVHDHVVVAPVEHAGGVRDGDCCSAVNGDLLDRFVQLEREPLSVWRKARTLSVLGTAHLSQLDVAHPSDEDRALATTKTTDNCEARAVGRDR